MMVIFAAVVAVELVGKSEGGAERRGEWWLDDFHAAISAMIVEIISHLRINCDGGRQDG